jgi:alkanesulfonate monooxygenase SsuD/methylene tetrahydromethanopterin reductase-like flavin-dependent oxidoreductase (luciferase family)
MKIQLSALYWPWYSFEEQVGLALAADEAGIDCVWVSEASSRCSPCWRTGPSGSASAPV